MKTIRWYQHIGDMILIKYGDIKKLLETAMCYIHKIYFTRSL